MSERARDGRASVYQPRSRGALALLWAAAAVFLALLAILAVRVAAGQDPALVLARPPRRCLPAAYWFAVSTNAR